MWKRPAGARLSLGRGAEERELGVTFFDTAEAYGPWTNEELVGEALAPLREKVVIATKFGWNIDPETGKQLPGLNSRPDHVKRVADAMLKRLGTAFLFPGLSDAYSRAPRQRQRQRSGRQCRISRSPRAELIRASGLQGRNRWKAHLRRWSSASVRASCLNTSTSASGRVIIT